MKIIINTSHQRFGGAIQVALSFIYECLHFPENEYHVWVGPGLRNSLIEAHFTSNFYFYYFDFGKINLGKTFRINHELKGHEKKIQPDVIISTSGPTYFHSCAPQIIGFNLPLYIYPDSPYVQQWGVYRKLKMLIKKELHYYFFRRDASIYVVQTDDVNTRVRKELKTDKVLTVTNTSSRFYDNPDKYPNKLPPKLNGEFRFLTLSAYYPHKNLEIIPKIVDKLINMGVHHIKFVLTIKNEVYERLIGNNPYIINIGPVLPEEGPSLYQECDGMFLPTLAECFSASYPEAMKMGKPIVTTNLGFAKSICKDAALYFDPLSAQSAVEQIMQIVINEPLRQQLIEKGKLRVQHFDTAFERTRKYLKICEGLIE